MGHAFLFLEYDIAVIWLTSFLYNYILSNLWGFYYYLFILFIYFYISLVIKKRVELKVLNWLIAGLVLAPRPSLTGCFVSELTFPVC